MKELELLNEAIRRGIIDLGDIRSKMKVTENNLILENMPTRLERLLHRGKAQKTSDGTSDSKEESSSESLEYTEFSVLQGIFSGILMVSGDDMNNRISTAALKHIAIISMLIDHLTQHLYLPIAEAKGVSELAKASVFLVGSLIIGRIAFILFAYTCSLSVMYSRNIKKYLLRLLIFGFVSEIPFDLANHGTFLEFTSQNVFFTLFLGTLTIVLCNLIDAKIKNDKCNEYGEDDKDDKDNKDNKDTKVFPVEILKLIVFIITMMCAYALNSDYGAAGVLLIYLMYRNRTDSRQMIVFAFIPFLILLGTETWFKETGGVITDIGDTIFTCIGCAITEIAGLIGFKFIANYNHERGKQLNKWFYYIFYPTHLLLIAIIVKIVVN